MFIPLKMVSIGIDPYPIFPGQTWGLETTKSQDWDSADAEEEYQERRWRADWLSGENSRFVGRKVRVSHGYMTIKFSHFDSSMAFFRGIDHFRTHPGVAKLILEHSIKHDQTYQTD